jgi:diguanylate cyclase (GGDEF)-like protein
MPARRTIAIAACVLLLAQIVTIAVWTGTTRAAVASDLVQIALGLLCFMASLDAHNRSARTASYHWRWLAASFLAFVAAQVLGTYIDFTSDHSCDHLDDILFSASVIPTAMLPFLDPDREQSRFDRLHVFDFVQAACFWVSIYLYFHDKPGIGLADVGWAGIGWSSSLAFHGVLTLSFVLRTVLSKTKAARGFFGGMAAYVFLAGLTDSYAALPSNNVRPGHWLDLIWSSLFGIPLLIALTWNPKTSLTPQLARAERALANHLFPLVFPFFAILFLVQDARENPALSSAIAMITFAALALRILIIQHRLFRAQDALQFKASHDALTRVCNRGAVLEILGKEIARQHRTGEPLTIMLVDVDHFKAVNDTYGHLIGDQVLRELAHRITRSIRACDSVGRYGGEEFLVVIPNCDSHGAVTAGERLRSHIANIPIPTALGPVMASVSAGVVSTSNAKYPASHPLLLRLADAALYRAKAAGRNRVEHVDYAVAIPSMLTAVGRLSRSEIAQAYAEGI